MAWSKACTCIVSESLIVDFNADIAKRDLFHQHLMPNAKAVMVTRCIFVQGICFTRFYEVNILWHFMGSLSLD